MQLSTNPEGKSYDSNPHINTKIEALTKLQIHVLKRQAARVLQITRQGLCNGVTKSQNWRLVDVIFFSWSTNLDTFKPNGRTHKLFKFIKNYRKNCQKPSTNYIPIQKWNDTLNSINSTKPQLSIRTLITGKTPGIDSINMELIQNLTPTITKILRDILEKAWTSNKIPTEWTTTIQVPLVPSTIRSNNTCNIGRKNHHEKNHYLSIYLFI
jgi:hypothetical protein